jgi:four helix bundle protein
MAKTEKEEFVQKFRNRTKAFSLRALKIFQKLPKTEESRIIGKQFLRSALSVGANYRAVCRARSKAEFFSKLSVTVEEADEVIFWIEILRESEILKDETISAFEREAKEIVAVLSTARSNTK